MVIRSWFLSVQGDPCDVGAYLSGGMGDVDLSLPASVELNLGGGEASAGGWFFRVFDLEKEIHTLPADEKVWDSVPCS